MRAAVRRMHPPSDEPADLGVETTTPRRAARLAGVSYVFIFLCGIFANFIVLEGMWVVGDAAATASNIAANELLFRVGIVSFAVMVVFDVVVAWALYLLLEPVDANLSRFAAWLRLVNGAIFAVALFHLPLALQLLDGVATGMATDPAGAHAQVMVQLAAFDQTWLIGLLFFGLHLLILGLLTLRSGFVPKFIGVLLMVAGVGYLADTAAHVLVASYADFEAISTMVVILPGVVGELSFTIWLLIRGFRSPRETPAT